MAARRGARSLPRRALAGLGRRPPQRLAHRRGRPGPRQRVFDAALRPGLARLVPRARRATPGWTGQACRRSVPARDVIGPLRAARRARRLASRPRCHVAVGTGDDHGAALGAGAVAPGIVVDVTGTAEPVAVPSRRARARRASVGRDPRSCGRRHAADRESRLRLGRQHELVGQGAAASRRATCSRRPRWLHRGATVRCSCRRCPGPPRRAGTTRMRGCFAGLGLHHDLAHLARAILEGCSFALRDIVDRFAEMGLGGEEIRVVGGGARSPLWLQIKADVTGRPVRVVSGETPPAPARRCSPASPSGFFADLRRGGGPDGAARRRAGAPATRDARRATRTPTAPTAGCSTASNTPSPRLRAKFRDARGQNQGFSLYRNCVRFGKLATCRSSSSRTATSPTNARSRSPPGGASRARCATAGRSARAPRAATAVVDGGGRRTRRRRSSLLPALRGAADRRGGGAAEVPLP